MVGCRGYKEKIKMKTLIAYVPIVALVLLLLGGCALTPQGRAAKEALGQGIVFVKAAHFKVAMSAEELRCKRPMGLVMEMGDALGDAWFTGLVGNCPNMQAFIKRALATFELVPIAAPRS